MWVGSTWWMTRCVLQCDSSWPQKQLDSQHLINLWGKLKSVFLHPCKEQTRRSCKGGSPVKLPLTHKDVEGTTLNSTLLHKVLVMYIRMSGEDIPVQLYIFISFLPGRKWKLLSAILLLLYMYLANTSDSNKHAKFCVCKLYHYTCTHAYTLTQTLACTGQLECSIKVHSWMLQQQYSIVQAYIVKFSTR